MTVLPTDLLKTEWLFPIGALQSFRNEQLGQRAEQMAAKLKAAERLPVWDAQDSPLVLAGRRFFKLLPSINDPRIEACRRELLALKLGISPEVFCHNAGFEEFATENHLERYLSAYHQSLLVDPKDVRLSILMDNRYVPWESAREAMSRFPKHTSSPLQPWKYGPNGIQNDDMYDWVRHVPPRTHGTHPRLFRPQERRGAVAPVHPKVDDILAETYGIMAYQEQVMQVLNRLGKLPLNRALTLIKAISKKKEKVIDVRAAELRGRGRGQRHRPRRGRATLRADPQVRRLRLQQGPLHPLRDRGLPDGVLQGLTIRGSSWPPC